MGTRPRFHPSATCGFVGKNRVVLDAFRFPRTSENRDKSHCSKAKTRQHPVVANTSKVRCRKTEQQSFFVSAPRRIRGNCITETMNAWGATVPLQILARTAFIHFRGVMFPGVKNRTRSPTLRHDSPMNKSHFLYREGACQTA